MKNAEGYNDPTVAEAWKGITRAEVLPEAGEIWTDCNGIEFVVLKGNNGCFTALKLRSVEDAGSIPVMSMVQRYTVPSMISYVIMRNYGHFVKKLSDNEFRRIMDAVKTSLFGVSVDNGERMLREARDEITVLKDESVKLREELDKALMEVEHQKTLKADLKQELEMERKKAHGGDAYKELYYELLDRVLGGKKK